ncbi:uncharacterized protein Pyn_36900 [Prunus yedoensis var. nudiflora]|uniref:RNase H type-1 domain-containing protein n=1 Tax=Prunus yedoensis var. nudiflora TaxID=2094558 RepID=A0A314Y9D3_PRUYE|nr:uncharacterized protein Pyn_36900 [Prunus yedoensis var. nudiflora]
MIFLASLCSAQLKTRVQKVKHLLRMHPKRDPVNCVEQKLDDLSRKHAKIDHFAVLESPPLNHGSCILMFDGASKGNPGLAGAGAVLRADDGSLICKVREGLGIATNNVAEYRAVILGLKCALRKGFSKIVVQGDSKLVCMQVQGLWKVKNQNMSDLYEEVKKLKDKFLSFKISHVLRGRNSEADAQANLAITLADGQVQEVSGSSLNDSPPLVMLGFVSEN